MADINKTIEILFTAVDDVSGNVASISSSVDSSISKISSVTAPVAELTSSLVKLEVGIVAAGAALVGFSINQAGTFQTSIGEIGALFNATSEQSRTLGDDIISFAKDSVFSIEDINKSTFTAISTGTEWTNVTTLLSQAQQLAVAGSSDLSVATAALTRTLNAYGFEATEAERVSNALFVAAQLGDTNLTDLGNNFGNLASTAAASNVQLEESLAAVSALTVSGIKTAEVMTQLRALFRELSTPSKELAEALGDTTIESDGLQAVLAKVAIASGGTQAGVDRLFGSIEAVNAALILSKDSTGAFDNALTQLANKTGKVEAAYSNLVNNFTNLNQKLANSVQVALIAAGDDILDEYGDITKALSAIFNSIGVDAKSGALDTVIFAIEDFGSQTATLLDGIAKALPEALENVDYSGVINSFKDLFSSIGDLTGDIDLTDSAQLTKSIQFIIDSLDSLTRFTRGVVEAFQPVIAIIFDSIDAFNSLSDAQKEAAGNFGGSAQIFEQFKGLIAGATKALAVFTGSLQVIAGSLAIGALQGISKELLASGSAAEIAGSRIAKLASLLGKGGLLGAAGAAGFALGDLLNLKGGVDSLVETFTGTEGQTLGGAIYDLLHAGDGETTSSSIKLSAEAVDALSSSTGDAVTNVASAEQSLTDFDDTVKKVANDSITASNISAEYATKMEALGFSVDPTTGALTKLSEEVANTADSQERALDSAAKYKVELIDGVTTYTQVGNALAKVSDELDTNKQKTDQLSESQRLAINNSARLEETLAELASNERIAAFEFTANIRVAEIEADAQKAVAAFDSIATSITSANSLSGELFSQLSDPNLSGFDKFTLEAGIRDAQKQAKEAAELQKILVEAQVKNLNARTKLINDGGGTINVLADNLAPELQQVLKSLINNIRVQAINEGLEILT